MPEPRLIPAAKLYRLINASISEDLDGANFAAFDKRTWIRSTRRPLHEVIQFLPPFWGGVSFVWGISLDFVPHVSSLFSYSIRWPNAFEKLDLIYHPLDYVDWVDREQIRKWTIPCHDGMAAAEEAIQTNIPFVLGSAFSFFDSIQTEVNLPAAFKMKLERPRPRFGPAAGGELMLQEQLAFAFTSVRLGHRHEGREWLTRFILSDPRMPHVTRTRLSAMYDAATEGAKPPYEVGS